ncbi:MAG: YwqG family protein [Chloroflexota bacterium]
MAKTFSEVISASNLPHKEKLLGLVRQALYINRDAADPQSQEPGVSRFGGRPDLPPEFEWPKWQDKSLSFIAQINLSELPNIPDRGLLPETGMLFFFYDSSRLTDGVDKTERGCFAVYYANENEKHPPVTRAAPADLRAAEMIVPARISFEVVESVPSWEHPVLESLGYAFENCSVYSHVVFYDSQGYYVESHQMLGYPQPVQYPPDLECEYVRLDRQVSFPEIRTRLGEELKNGVDNWELLLQVVSDNEMNMYWPPDCGTLYYMIRRSDLLSGQFDLAWMVKHYG